MKRVISFYFLLIFLVSTSTFKRYHFYTTYYLQIQLQIFLWELSFLFLRVFLPQAFSHFNNFNLSRFSILPSDKDPGTTLGMEFFALTLNGFWFLGVVVNSFVLDVAVFSISSLNLLLCIMFSISKGVYRWQLKFQLKNVLNLSSLVSVQ